ncbi:MAG: glycosyltransferase family 39 protein [Candidatus Kerfeldbacteria bacterium]|nr:glycosyltransferase family 39 protein [Candidatus Kerfeldbacteria bacterium]
MEFKKHSALMTVVFLALIGVGASLFALNEAHRNRVVTTDSIVYVETARHIAQGQGIRTSILNINDTELEPAQTQYPPLYSMTMAPFIAAGLDPILAGRLVSAISLGLLVLFVGLWMWRMLGALPAVATAALLTTLPSLTSTSAAVWTDPLYTLITVTLVSLGTRVLKRPSAFRWFVLGSLVGAAIFTKYLGLVLIAVALAFLVLFDLRNWLKTSSLRPALYVLLGMALFLVPLLSRNVLLSRPIGGAVRHFSGLSLGAILADTWNTLSVDFTRNWIWDSILILVVVSLIIVFRNRDGRERFKQIGHDLIIPVVLSIVVYVLGLIVTRWFIDTDPIHTRFLVPVYPLVAVVFVALVATAGATFNKRLAIIFLSILALVSMGWTIKAYDFGAAPYAIQETSRMSWVRQNTTNNDLLIGDHAPEYNLWFNRTVMRLSGNPTDQKLTAQYLQLLKARWSDSFDRLLLTLTPGLNPLEYGEFIARLSAKDVNGTPVVLVHEEPKLLLYEVQ